MQCSHIRFFWKVLQCLCVKDNLNKYQDVISTFSQRLNTDVDTMDVWVEEFVYFLQFLIKLFQLEGPKSGKDALFGQSICEN